MFYFFFSIFLVFPNLPFGLLQISDVFCSTFFIQIYDYLLFNVGQSLLLFAHFLIYFCATLFKNEPNTHFY